MIVVNSLDVQYDNDKILKDINFDLEKGDTCAIIGPSGCGKTTLIYTLAGIVKPTNGKVEINGEEISDVRKNTGVILQNYGLLPWKTVKDNLSLPLKVRNVSKHDINTRVIEMSNNLNIKEKLDKYPSQLSGGEKQRVAIGRTLIYKPDLLLLDEASSALDQITKESIQNLILQLYKKEKFSLVMVTHSIEEAVFLGKKIVIMDKGIIKKIVYNKHFGTSRTTEEFYKGCIEVRKALEQVNINEK